MKVIVLKETEKEYRKTLFIKKNINPSDYHRSIGNKKYKWIATKKVHH